MSKFEKGHVPILERRFTPADIDRMWELFFGKKWGLNHIAAEYGTSSSAIAAIIDAESARRWKKNHPHETNQERRMK
jgi:hypothetical protein